jgi:homogentisate 1,2-dioxygenase
LDEWPLLIPLQQGAFLRLLVAFTDPLGIKVPVSWYQSIDMHCIVLLVKFEGGLTISVLRKKALFITNWGLNFHGFKLSIDFSHFQKKKTQAWGMRPPKSRPNSNP